MCIYTHTAALFKSHLALKYTPGLVGEYSPSTTNFTILSALYLKQIMFEVWYVMLPHKRGGPRPASPAKTEGLLLVDAKEEAD